MKSNLLFVALLTLLTLASTQQDHFDYNKFLTVFTIRFNYERFAQVFFNTGNLLAVDEISIQSGSFNYDDFVNTFLVSRGVDPQEFDYESFVKTFMQTEVQKEAANKEFDFETFRKVFGLECKEECPEDFDYEKFTKAFNLQKESDPNFDYEKFVDSFGLKPSKKPFDWERFAQTFLWSSTKWPAFDSKRFFSTFFVIERENGKGGAVVIVDQPLKKLEQN